MFSFLFELNGLTMQTVDGFTHFVNGNGETVFTLGSLFAVDANGKPTDALTYDFVPVKGNDDQVIVTVTLDNDYLTAADRVFPVVIDPTVMISSSQTADTCVCEGYPTTNYYTAAQLRTGYDSEYKTRISYLKFSIPTYITAGNVISSRIEMEKVSGDVPKTRAYRVTEPWNSNILTWNTRADYTEEGMSSISVPYSSTSNWYVMNITDIVTYWVNSPAFNYGLAIVDTLPTNQNCWTTWYSSDADSPHKPELYITYSASTSTSTSIHYVHHYDTTFPSALVSLIPGVARAAGNALQNQFGYSITSSSSVSLWSLITASCSQGDYLPCSTTDCGEGHHKEIYYIHQQLCNKINSSEERHVFWTDRGNGVYCNHSSGSCSAISNMIASAYGKTICIYNIPVSSSNVSEYEAYMGITLMHETSHTPPMNTDDSNSWFEIPAHSAYGYQCIMEYGGEDPENFYSRITLGLVDPVCSTCVKRFNLP